jgi:hypothetical protein
VYPERSSRRVLTLERLVGPTLMEAAESDLAPEERWRIGRLLVFAIWGSFYAARLVHADPHPGNFLVLPDGRLGVLDFGATKRLSSTFAEVYRAFLRANAGRGKRPEVGPALVRGGFRILGDEDDAYEFCERIAAIVERPTQVPEYDFGADPMVGDVRRLFHANASLALSVKPPTEAVLFYRAAAGLAQDLRLLKARGPFARLLGEIVDRGVIDP